MTERSLDTKTARAVISTLQNAVMPRSHPSEPIQWRQRRDRWVDTLDPTNDTASLVLADVRDLVDFLHESAPSLASRKTTEEWTVNVDSITTRILSAFR